MTPGIFGGHSGPEGSLTLPPGGLWPSNADSLTSFGHRPVSARLARAMGQVWEGGWPAVTFAVPGSSSVREQAELVAGQRRAGV